MGGGAQGGRAVRLTAPSLEAAADYYVTVLGLERTRSDADHTVLAGHGAELTLARGDGQGLEGVPSAESASAELTVPLETLEAAWAHDRRRMPERQGPTLDEQGTFVYVTADPAGNAIVLLTPLPEDADQPSPERETQRLKRFAGD